MSTDHKPRLRTFLKFGGAAAVGAAFGGSLPLFIVLFGIPVERLVVALGLVTVVALFAGLAAYIGYRYFLDRIVGFSHPYAVFRALLLRPSARKPEDHQAVSEAVPMILSTVGLFSSFGLALAVATNATLLATLGASYLQVKRLEQQNAIFQAQVDAAAIESVSSVLASLDSRDENSVAITLAQLELTGEDGLDALLRLANHRTLVGQLARTSLIRTAPSHGSQARIEVLNSVSRELAGIWRYLEDDMRHIDYALRLGATDDPAEQPEGEDVEVNITASLDPDQFHVTVQRFRDVVDKHEKALCLASFVNEYWSFHAGQADADKEARRIATETYERIWPSLEYLHVEKPSDLRTWGGVHPEPPSNEFFDQASRAIRSIQAYHHGLFSGCSIATPNFFINTRVAGRTPMASTLDGPARIANWLEFFCDPPSAFSNIAARAKHKAIVESACREPSHTDEYAD